MTQTVILTQPVRVSGSVLAAGTTQTLARDIAADLVARGFATSVGTPVWQDVQSFSPRVVASQKGAYIIMPNTLTFSGAAGAFTLSAAIFAGMSSSIGSGFWGYFPADSGSAGLAAGWYFCTMSTDTAGIRYADVAAATGSPFPATPTAFTANLSGANAGTTAEITCFSATIPGKSMGPNGRIDITALIGGNSASVTKDFKAKLGSSAEQIASWSITNTTTNALHRDFRIFNLGSENRQWSPPTTATTTVSGVNYSAIDTSLSQEISFTLQTSSAASAVALLYCSVSTLFQP
jgi:hypothetical protein